MEYLPYWLALGIGTIVCVDSVAGLAVSILRFRLKSAIAAQDRSLYQKRQLHIYIWKGVLNAMAVGCVVGSWLIDDHSDSSGLLRAAFVLWGLTYLIMMQLGFCKAGQQQRRLRIMRNGWYGCVAIGATVAAILI